MLWCLNISKNARSCALFLCCDYKGLMSVSSLGSQTEPRWPEALSPAPRAACGVVCFHLNNEWHGWWAHTKTQQRPACRSTRLTESAAQTLIKHLYTALVWITSCVVLYASLCQYNLIYIPKCKRPRWLEHCCASWAFIYSHVLA